MTLPFVGLLERLIGYSDRESLCWVLRIRRAIFFDRKKGS